MNDDGRLTGLFIEDNFASSPHLNPAMSCSVGLNNTGSAINNRSGWKIRT